MLSINYYVYFWVFYLLSLLLLFIFIFIIVILKGSFILVLNIFPFPLFEFSLLIDVDVYSRLFSSVVLFISLVVFLFSITYFQRFEKRVYFFWITFFFILSILILINFSDLFIVILGWDGLGVVSFFLIVFYQSPSRVYSGIFTIFINRIGDCLFIITISLFSYFFPFLGYFWYLNSNLLIVYLRLFVCFITKRAIFPFSPWLPAAIAAPTPISSLVHSSTLVTAGLYLIIRHASIIYCSQEISYILVTLGVFTSFYAGCSSLLESDLKKVVALSTLSHLGFICIALGIGWEVLAFFHLLTHALFKSSLFMAVGSLITFNYHYQDSRYFSSFLTNSPFSSSLIFISEGSLVGFPFFSGFYSKDYVLESFHFSTLSSLLYLLIILNLFFTFVYSFRVIRSLISFRFSNVYFLTSFFNFFHVGFLRVLSLLSIFMGGFILTIWDFSLFALPFTFKMIPFMFLVIFLIIFIFSPIRNSFINHYWVTTFPLQFFSNIIFLLDFFTSFLSKKTYTMSSFNNSFELGGFSYFIYRYWIIFYSYVSQSRTYLFSLRLSYSITLGILLFLFLLL